MRIYVNSLYYDFDYPFAENYMWQHISVHYTLLYAHSGSDFRSTLITVYVDGVEQISVKVDDAVN